MRAVRVGTRSSALARWQTDYVVGRLKAVDAGLALEVVEISSAGDDMPQVPIESMEGTGFFTSTLERALQGGEIDVAVHSCKDLPVAATAGLVVAAMPERAAVEDALCARGGARLSALEPGARVGTSSLRRTAQLRALRPDLEYLPLRGNVPTRVDRVASGDLDATVLARAGLERLGLMRHATEVFPPETLLPAPAQGALAVQMRTGEPALERLLAMLDHPATRRAVVAERTLLHALGGGCSVPVGAYARPSGGSLHLIAGVFEIETGRGIRVDLEGGDPESLGREGARRLIERGAGEILAALEKEPRPAGGPSS